MDEVVLMIEPQMTRMDSDGDDLEISALVKA